MAKMFERAPLDASSDAWDDLAGAIVAEDYFDAEPTGLVKVFTAAGWTAHAVKVWMPGTILPVRSSPKTILTLRPPHPLAL